MKKIIGIVTVVIIFISFAWCQTNDGTGAQMERYSAIYRAETKENEVLGKYKKEIVHTTVYSLTEMENVSRAYEMEWQASIIYDWEMKNPDSSFPLSPSPMLSSPCNKENTPISTFSGGFDGGFYVKLDIPTSKYFNIASVEIYDQRGGMYKGKAAYFCQQDKPEKNILMNFETTSFYINGDSLDAIHNGTENRCSYLPLEPEKVVFSDDEQIDKQRQIFKVAHYRKVFHDIPAPEALEKYGKVFFVNNSEFLATKEGVHPEFGEGVWVSYDGKHEMFYQSMAPDLYDAKNFEPVSGDSYGPFAGKDGRLMRRVL